MFFCENFAADPRREPRKNGILTGVVGAFFRILHLFSSSTVTLEIMLVVDTFLAKVQIRMPNTATVEAVKVRRVACHM